MYSQRIFAIILPHEQAFTRFNKKCNWLIVDYEKQPDQAMFEQRMKDYLEDASAAAEDNEFNEFLKTQADLYRFGAIMFGHWADATRIEALTSILDSVFTSLYDCLELRWQKEAVMLRFLIECDKLEVAKSRLKKLLEFGPPPTSFIEFYDSIRTELGLS